MVKKYPRRVTFAVADDVPIGVVCVVMSPGLSRLFSWDTETDTFIPGQYLKADAAIQSITPDGKYFSYAAYSHYRKPQRYVCIARPPYFTALAFFPTSQFSRAGINFVGSERAIVNAENDTSISDEIVPGCPLVMDRASEIHLAISCQYFDERKGRYLYSQNHSIVERLDSAPEEHVIHAFEYEYFMRVEPPNWAKIW